MKRPLGLLLVSATLIFGSIGTARGADFTFTVPVRLLSIPAATATAWKVRCEAYRLGTGTTTIGFGESPHFPMSPDGNFSQNLVVTFNASTGQDPGAATRWACGLQLMIGGNWQFLRQNAQLAKSGTAFVSDRSGDLPE